MTNPALEQLVEFIQRYPRLVVLTGAGVSLASGIPTYRDEKGEWQRGKPIQHQEFINQPELRQRYWARSLLGWGTIANAKPNTAHYALAQLEQLGHSSLLISQNVDNLHQTAGNHSVVDLHGNLTRVTCLNCHTLSSRHELQARLIALNPDFKDIHVEIRPDGDANFEGEAISRFQIPPCLKCGGELMPDVVFFGGTVPIQRVETCLTALENADALLVVGSSLKVYSGYRFCVRAKEWNKPIALLNPGWTRADEIASLKLSAPCADILQELVIKLS